MCLSHVLLKGSFERGAYSVSLYLFPGAHSTGYKCFEVSKDEVQIEFYD